MVDKPLQKLYNSRQIGRRTHEGVHHLGCRLSGGLRIFTLLESSSDTTVPAE